MERRATWEGDPAAAEDGPALPSREPSYVREPEPCKEGHVPPDLHGAPASLSSTHGAARYSLAQEEENLDQWRDSIARICRRLAAFVSGSVDAHVALASAFILELCRK
ncbi:hypothetical protein PR202_ga15042 [Eleusine coracana subsp. coracana]|uniref:PH domain-containing protein n=1 Tax=Eleusine coracana subsp. coracana TaxID=191504 RepID=A0AAV5CIZ3_ELECO|nr:hypothetical protein PR202_ga15042 [Eleusine coracana subsp. coracana]